MACVVPGQYRPAQPNKLSSNWGEWRDWDNLGNAIATREGRAACTVGQYIDIIISGSGKIPCLPTQQTLSTLGLYAVPVVNSLASVFELYSRGPIIRCLQRWLETLENCLHSATSPSSAVAAMRGYVDFASSFVVIRLLGES